MPLRGAAARIAENMNASLSIPLATSQRIIPVKVIDENRRLINHHRALLDYCRRLNVALEPFIQLNHNAYLHASRAFGGAPQRIRAVKADFQGQVSELLAKATRQGKLDEAVTREDQEILLQALRVQDQYLAGFILMFVAMLTVVGMLISDLALAALDPRIRFAGRAV